VASQKTTWPLLTRKPFWSVTVAVNVTAVPTIRRFDETLSAVVVFKTFQAKAGVMAKQMTTRNSGLVRVRDGASLYKEAEERTERRSFRSVMAVTTDRISLVFKTVLRFVPCARKGFGAQSKTTGEYREA
jgi:hypothetical protein